jgi:hypothetical protein
MKISPVLIALVLIVMSSLAGVAWWYFNKKETAPPVPTVPAPAPSVPSVPPSQVPAQCSFRKEYLGTWYANSNTQDKGIFVIQPPRGCTGLWSRGTYTVGAENSIILDTPRRDIVVFNSASYATSGGFIFTRYPIQLDEKINIKGDWWSGCERVIIDDNQVDEYLYQIESSDQIRLVNDPRTIQFSSDGTTGTFSDGTIITRAPIAFCAGTTSGPSSSPI